MAALHGGLLNDADIQAWLDEKSAADLVGALYQILEPVAWADQLCTPAVPITTPAPNMFSESTQKGHKSMPGPRPQSVPQKSTHFSSRRHRCAQTHCHRSGRETILIGTRCSPSSSSSSSSTCHRSITRSSLPELRRGASLCFASWPYGRRPVK